MTRRKQPDKRSNRVSLIKSLAQALGGTISRHPSIAGCIAAIAVTFGYVSMNAMYQPEKHPAPWFNTRAEGQFYASRQPKEVPIPASRVTTFKIERSDPQSTASIPDTSNPLRNNTVFLLQQAMLIKGVYAGPADGVVGPQTRKAIQIYQAQAGLELTGEPSDELLVHVLMSNLTIVATPQKRPVVDRSSAVTSQIWSRSQTIAAEQKARRKKADPVAELIVDIQTGLSNIAYAEIEVDGVVGEQTRTAIADFQKHYRLPVTGKPDSLVLSKLREIGAL
jgi:peptidoglycan hydrolase-like protein with peptidoglycan-binding domain